MNKPSFSENSQIQLRAISAIAACLSLCEVELQILKAGYGKNAVFDAFTIIRRPMGIDDIAGYSDEETADIAREALELFCCLNDWISVSAYSSPISTDSIAAKARLLGDINARFASIVVSR